MADLRPMEFGEVLDGALQLFRRHFGLFLKLSLAVMWLPLAFYIYLLTRFVGLNAATPQQAAAVMQSELVPFVLFGLVWAVLYFAGMLLLTAGSIRVISDIYLGREPEFGESLQFGLGKIVPLFLVGLGKGLLLLLLYILCAVVLFLTFSAGGVAVLLGIVEVPAMIWLFFYVVCGYMVTTPVVVLETLSSNFDAFGRSWELTRGAKLKMFGFAFVGWFLITILLPWVVTTSVGSLVLQMVPKSQLVSSIISAIFPIMVAPIYPCVLTLAYYDQRVRREGFDLQLLSEQLGGA